MTVPRSWLAADIVLKAAMVVLLGFALLHQDWDRFADKAMTARAVVYPLLVAVVPVIWLLLRRSGRGGAYPGAASALLTVPFVVDLAGNALNLYDDVEVFDDICHFVNWAMLSGAVGLVLLRQRGLPAWALGALVLGFGATTAILWEIGEYGAFILDTPESVTAYRDTLGDLGLGTAGSALAGLVCALAARRRSGEGAPSGALGPAWPPPTARRSR